MYERVPEERYQEYDYYKERPNDLKKLSDMENWHVASGEPDIKGWKVTSQKKPDDQIAEIDDLLVSQRAGAAIMAIVSYGGFMGMGEDSTVVPIDRLELDTKNDKAIFLGDQDDLKNAPKYDENIKDFGPFYDYWSGRERVRGVETDIEGWDLYDRNNQDQIGEVQNVLGDSPANRSPLVVVNYGGFWGMGDQKTLVPMDVLNVHRDEKRVVLQVAKDDLKNAPKYTEDVKAYEPFYDYWSGRRVEAVAAETREVERPRMETRVEGREQVIPEVTEHLEVSKHPEQVGEVRISKEVEMHPETIHATTTRTRLHVYRKKLEPGRAPEAGARELKEGETIEIPIMEEQLTVTKRPEIEEVVVEPETIQEEKEVTEQVREEHVRVQTAGETEVEEEEEETRRRL